MVKRVYVIRGGVIGPDGYALSYGMDLLAARIRRLPNVVCDVWSWSSWRRIHDELLKPTSAKRVLVGYSGGGSRATWIAHESPMPAIELMIGYDPSPWYQTCEDNRGKVFALPASVKRAICYHNLSPNFGMFGGGIFRGPQAENQDLRQSHAMVQFNEALHLKTLAAIVAL